MDREWGSAESGNKTIRERQGVTGKSDEDGHGECGTASGYGAMRRQ